MMEEAALADMDEYQDRLAEARKKGIPPPAIEGDGTMAEKQLNQNVQEAGDISRELEQENQRLQQQLLDEVVAHRELRETHREFQVVHQELKTANTRIQQQVQQLQEQVRH